MTLIKILLTGPGLFISVKWGDIYSNEPLHTSKLLDRANKVHDLSKQYLLSL